MELIVTSQLSKLLILIVQVLVRAMDVVRSSRCHHSNCRTHSPLLISCQAILLNKRADCRDRRQGSPKVLVVEYLLKLDNNDTISLRPTIVRASPEME